MSTPEQLVLKFLGKLIVGTEFEGHAYLAGGAVRDEIMGKPVKDIDIVVSAPDGGIRFATWVAKKTGTYKEGVNPVVFERFGTAKFNLRGLKVGDVDISDVDIEVVMTRGEKYEKGSRKPEVVFADLKDDAFRRDLTVNSLFKDLVTGDIKDLTGTGLDDIKRGIVRTPTNPDQTFKDDPLRMMRAVRFAVKYGWKMPMSMIKALKKNADMLPTISKERIRDELVKILMTDNPDAGLRILMWTGLNKHIIPELDACVGVTQNEYHKDDVYDHILEVVKNTPADSVARIAALMHDIGKPQTRSVGPDGRVHFYKHEEVGAEMAEQIMQRLKFTNEETQTVKSVVSHHMELKNSGMNGEKATDRSLRKFVTRLGKDLVPALKVMHADNVSHEENASMPNQILNITKRIEDLKNQGSASDTPNLPINGHDIIKTLGIKPGPEVKHMLDAVQDAWFENPNIDRETALKLVTDLHARKLAKKNFDDVLNQKITNAVTKNKILVKTALKYDKSHPARKVAMQILQTARGK